MSAANFDVILERQAQQKAKAKDFPAERKAALAAHWAKRFRKRGYDDQNKSLFNTLTNFCSYYWEGINRKGLFLCAAPGQGGKAQLNTGTGKTFGLRIIADIFDIRMANMANLVDRYQENPILVDDLLKQPNCYASKKKNDKIIDEVGAEKIVNDYGNKFEYFPTVLEDRYNEFLFKGAQTHFTSNLTAAQLTARYGERVWSRINEMCTIIEVTGVDRRIMP